MTAYYNEHDAQKAAWLRELMRQNLIAVGEVDERSIEEVQPDDLAGFAQCHFFAGVGAWSYALRNAGWSDGSPVWTGSCPCPSFSSSGKGEGFSDPRHLWPAWFRLIRVVRPHVLFGEQVASDSALAWLDLVSSDLEGEDYAIGATDLCAAGVGAPHIRQRLYFVADTPSRNAEQRDVQPSGQHGLRAPDRRGDGASGYEERTQTSDLGDTGESGLEGRVLDSAQQGGRKRDVPRSDGAADNAWGNVEWLPCRDGKARPVEPGTFPLAHGSPARVVRLRGYGDAIVAPLAQAFIEAYSDIRGAA